MTAENGEDTVKNNQKAAPARAKLQAKLQELEGFLTRANKGDDKVLTALRDLLREPDGAWLLTTLGDLAVAARNRFIDRYARDQRVIGEALTIKLDQLRAELSGPDPSPLEKLLVERVLICWLQVHIADCTFAGATNATLNQGEYYQRNQSRAQVRYLAAIKMLVMIRKLLQPTLSPLEIASRPVNETAGTEVGLRRDGRPAMGVAVEN